MVNYFLFLFSFLLSFLLFSNFETMFDFHRRIIIGGEGREGTIVQWRNVSSEKLIENFSRNFKLIHSMNDFSPSSRFSFLASLS